MLTEPVYHPAASWRGMYPKERIKDGPYLCKDALHHPVIVFLPSLPLASFWPEPHLVSELFNDILSFLSGIPAKFIQDPTLLLFTCLEILFS